MVNNYRPSDIKSVLEIINRENCHIFAGGTDLMIRKRQWQGAERKFTQPIVFINQIDTLRGIEYNDDSYVINTLTTQTDIVESKLPDYLKVPYSLMSHPAIRNIATVGGNIVNAASVADSLPILYALDAKLELISVDGVREVKVMDFILDKYKTLRNTNELLTKVVIEKKTYESFYYKKLGQRKASILSKLSVFILNNGLDDVKIAIGAINNTVIRDENLEKAFVQSHDLEALLKGYKALMQGVDDKRSTKDYRETVALNLIGDYLKGVMDEL